MDVNQRETPRSPLEVLNYINRSFKNPEHPMTLPHRVKMRKIISGASVNSEYKIVSNYISWLENHIVDKADLNGMITLISARSFLESYHLGDSNLLLH